MLRWCEVTRMHVAGSVICVKDAMIMLDEGGEIPDYPYIDCEPGEYIFEIYLEPKTYHCHRARLRRLDSEPVVGKMIGNVDVDHSYIGMIDYFPFQQEVNSNFEDYSEWTVNDLDDELANNFSGKIEFNNIPLLYVESGDGDGTYSCYELIDGENTVGIECVFETE